MFRVAMAYFGGALGAALASLVLWTAYQIGALQMLGVSLTPVLSRSWIGPRLLRGSFFALAYPLARRRGYSHARSGALLSLAPSAYELFILMPSSGQGFLGLSLGRLTPLVVVVLNLIWGWALSRVMIAEGRS